MHELVMPNQVKIKYVRAIAKVHPDKVCFVILDIDLHLADDL